MFTYDTPATSHDMGNLYEACDQTPDFSSSTIDGRNLIFGHKLHNSIIYCGKRFWNRQIPTSCLPP
jgi:maltoporin